MSTGHTAAAGRFPGCTRLLRGPSQVGGQAASSADLPAPPAGERPFHCTLCEKAFNQKSALQVHMKKHTGERPYRCHCCAMGFTQKSNMKLHMKRAHSCTGEAPRPPAVHALRPCPPADSTPCPTASQVSLSSQHTSVP